MRKYFTQMFGLYEDRHNARFASDLLVENNPRLNVFALLRSGALTDGVVTRLKWGEKTCQLAAQRTFCWTMASSSSASRSSGTRRCHGSASRPLFVPSAIMIAIACMKRLAFSLAASAMACLTPL